MSYKITEIAGKLLDRLGAVSETPGQLIEQIEEAYEPVALAYANITNSLNTYSAGQCFGNLFSLFVMPPYYSAYAGIPVLIHAVYLLTEARDINPVIHFYSDAMPNSTILDRTLVYYHEDDHLKVYPFNSMLSKIQITADKYLWFGITNHCIVPFSTITWRAAVICSASSGTAFTQSPSRLMVIFKFPKYALE